MAVIIHAYNIYRDPLGFLKKREQALEKTIRRHERQLANQAFQSSPYRRLRWRRYRAEKHLKGIAEMTGKYLEGEERFEEAKYYERLARSLEMSRYRFLDEVLRVRNEAKPACLRHNGE